jgi:hypothetical protein
MKTVPVMSPGPIDDVRRADAQARAALGEAVSRTAQLWRDIEDPSAVVPGLTWSAVETAAHVVGDMREYTAALTRHVKGQRAVAEVPDGSPVRARTLANGRHLIDIAEREPRRLADMLEETAANYLATAASVEAADHRSIVTADGLVLEPAVMTCLLLGEQLVHGLDIARAVNRPWTIGRDDALLVIPAVLSIVPKYLRPLRTKDLSISFELRMRAGCRYRLAVDNGVGVVTVAGQKADCVITAEPVAFLLVGFGRVPQWSQLIRGKILAGGRKPWLAAKFGTLLEGA